MVGAWSHLDSGTLCSRMLFLALRYMRWATSSMAHSFTSRPRFSIIRISRLQGGEKVTSRQNNTRERERKRKRKKESYRYRERRFE